MNDQRPALALDMGGSLLKACIIERDGTHRALRRQPTPHDEPPADTARMMLRVAREVCAEAGIVVTDLAGIGISMAGFVTDDGIITATAHLSRAWIGFDLRTPLAAEIDLPYYFALDTPAPTLGEAYFGAGRGIPDFVYITVSTGIGSGIIAGGRLFTGGLGWAGGLGHSILDETSDRVCTGCGNHGCLETFAATQGILTTAREQMDAHPESALHRLTEANGGILTPKLVYDAAMEQDAIALDVWNRVGHALGVGLVNLVDIVSPTRIVVGGGISQAGDLLLEPARAVLRERCFPPRNRKVEVVQSELGDLSGAYGAAAMVFHDLRVNPRQQVMG
ncbi:MAG: ROK family protein [Anaerolineae bacterium]